jgi:hypothetical protein
VVVVGGGRNKLGRFSSFVGWVEGKELRGTGEGE